MQGRSTGDDGQRWGAGPGGVDREGRHVARVASVSEEPVAVVVVANERYT